MKMFKKLTAITILLALVLAIIPKGYADDFPKEIWKPLDKFAVALNNGNDEEILQLGESLIKIMENQPNSNLKSEFLAGKYEVVSRTAEKLGFYEKALEYYNKYLPYGEYMGWTDGVLFAKKKLYLLQPHLNLYFEDESYYPPFYGARFEPERGIYFGSVYDNDSRILDYDNDKILKYFPKKNSMYLIYMEFGDDIEALPRYKRYFTDAKKNNIAVEFAWNTYNSLEDIESHKEYIRKTIDYLGNSGLKIFLRFANEMNIGPNGDNPKAYVEAFRYVAEYAKTKSNIAVVWSPNDLGALNRPFSNYYPGDEYVDWIGTSLYAIKYFQGIKDHGAQTDPLNTYFTTGDFANPLMRITELMQFMDSNGIKKPVMITECGVTHYVRTEKEDTTAWAMAQMERLYAELIRLYPRIKGINYFNVQRQNETNAYELYTNQAVNDLYNKLVDSSYFLENLGDSAPFGYKAFEDCIIENGATISASAYYPKTLYNNVKYFIDGNFAEESFSPPYEFQINNLSDGNHTLKAELYDNGLKLIEKSVSFEVRKKVSIKLDGQIVEFKDQQPVIMEDRILVPARGIFEKMGMEVSWNEESRQVNIKKDKLELSIIIDDKVMKAGNREIFMDVPAMLINGRTMIPLRAVSEALAYDVKWDDAQNTAIIASKAKM